MSEKGVSSAHRSPGASATQRRLAARTAAPAGRGRKRSALVLACVAAGVTGTTWQVQGAPELAQGAAPVQQSVAGVAAAPSKPAAAVVAPALRPAAQVVVAAAAAPARAAVPVPGDGRPSAHYFAQLRSQVRWVPVNIGERQLATPDAGSRLLLAQSAAVLAGLEEVGLDFRDVYGVINAETTWVPRTGMGKNGVASYGLAQFEPATARAVGLRNPDDAVEAVHAAAVLLKEAATWSHRRVSALDLSPQMHAVKLREGVSIYYNLSTRARKEWNGANTHQLPVETRRHIRNVQVGAKQAEMLQARLGSGQELALAQVRYVPEPAIAPRERQPRAVVAAKRPVAVSGAAPRPAAKPTPAARPTVVADRSGRKTWVLPQGTIAWSGNS